MACATTLGPLHYPHDTEEAQSSKHQAWVSRGPCLGCCLVLGGGGGACPQNSGSVFLEQTQPSDPLPTSEQA